MAVVGPPNSGKTVFINNLRKEFAKKLKSGFQRDFFIIRANPDGEGDWYGDVSDEIKVILREKHVFDEEFVALIVQYIKDTKENKKFIIIDCGGKIDRTNLTFFKDCTQAILVSKDEIETFEWKVALKLVNLNLLAEIQSVPYACSEVIDRSTFRIGKLFRGEKDIKIPKEMMELILSEK